MNYKKLAKKYKPKKIKTILVGESPPQNGKTYFYLPIDKITIGSFPGTIFKHYFNRLPIDKKEYISFLEVLQSWGIWVIDITDKPVKVWVDRKNWIKDEKVIKKISNKLPRLKRRISRLKVSEDNVTFLLARNDYKSKVKKLFPYSSYYDWKSFRI